MLALVGLNANAAIYIVGDGPLGGWAFDGGNEMTAAGNGTYTYEMTIPRMLNRQSFILCLLTAAAHPGMSSTAPCVLAPPVAT